MEEFFNELKSDDFKIIQLEEDKLVGWVSFLDGMQRILLITEDVNLCYKVSNVFPRPLSLNLRFVNYLMLNLLIFVLIEKSMII